MLAVAERLRGIGDVPDVVIWHAPGDGAECDGDCDFHAIACSDSEGIVLPAPKRDVPVDLGVPGERWCDDCLAIISREPVIRR
ncbi:hypothetical protein [Streptomyces sp. NPDC059003]|uniref:hypothetical protein n=1 Tax=Streptomyces sp. NPDC059003 TaxID=3346691 RepID=UPI0036796081